jgi:hypothetical protein
MRVAKPDLQDLADRMQKLEGKVSSLRGFL